VLPHHGSLSRRLRLEAEARLKNGELRAVVATASLELGIDIGTVDLVCQIGSPRSIAVALAAHRPLRPLGGRAPKGRLFATTRDELIECAALVRAIRSGELDRTKFPPRRWIFWRSRSWPPAPAKIGPKTRSSTGRSTYSYRALDRAISTTSSPC
jgi:Lhr-like helicase